MTTPIRASNTPVPTKPSAPAKPLARVAAPAVGEPAPVAAPDALILSRPAAPPAPIGGEAAALARPRRFWQTPVGLGATVGAVAGGVGLAIASQVFLAGLPGFALPVVEIAAALLAGGALGAGIGAAAGWLARRLGA